MSFPFPHFIDRFKKLRNTGSTSEIWTRPSIFLAFPKPSKRSLLREARGYEAHCYCFHDIMPPWKETGPQGHIQTLGLESLQLLKSS